MKSLTKRGWARRWLWLLKQDVLTRKEVPKMKTRKSRSHKEGLGDSSCASFFSLCALIFSSLWMAMSGSSCHMFIDWWYFVDSYDLLGYCILVISELLWVFHGLVIKLLSVMVSHLVCMILLLDKYFFIWVIHWVHMDKYFFIWVILLVYMILLLVIFWYI
jgi:hypothetical protein